MVELRDYLRSNVKAESKNGHGARSVRYLPPMQTQCPWTYIYIYAVTILIIESGQETGERVVLSTISPITSYWY